MPIDTRHPEYIEAQDEWLRNRDAFTGTKAIKSRAVNIGDTAIASRAAVAQGNFAGSAYLPPLSGQSPSEYAAYRDRGLYHNVTGRVVKGFNGVMTRLPAKEELPDSLVPYFSDATADGISFDELYKIAVEEIIITNRVGILVDRFPDGRPYIVPYSAEAIINWDHNGKDFNWIVIELLVFTEGKDKYDHQFKEQWVELTREFISLDDDPDQVAQFVYIQNIWERTEKDADPVIVRTIMPRNRGIPMEDIPFWLVSDLGMTTDVRKAIASDIAEINISHYKTSCDLEHGRHFTALPTPVIVGAPGTDSVQIGSTTAIILPDPRSKAFYLEFTGQGLMSLENAIKEKEQQMSTMSARLIDQNRKGSEAEGTVKMRFAGESNMLTGIAFALEGVFNTAYKVIAVMEGEDPNEVVITVNKDFINDSVAANVLEVIFEMYLAEAIDIDTFIFNIRKAEMIDPTLTDSQIKAKLTALNTTFKSTELKAAAVKINAPISEPKSNNTES